MDALSKRDLQQYDIAFVGLGNMGVPMAAALCADGYNLTVYDLNQDTVAQFAREHGAGTDPEALENADIVILMLPNGTIVRDFLLAEDERTGSFASRMKPGAVVIDMSSSAPNGTHNLGEAMAPFGIDVIDAPVSGGVSRARTGKLAIMTGGDEAVVARIRPLLESMSSSITHCGRLGSGHAMKALNNYVSAAGLVAACEALRVAQHFGIDGERAIEVLNSSTGRNNSTENKLAQFVLPESYDSGFSLGLMRKDLAAAVELAAEMKMDLPLGAHLLSIWQTGEATLGVDADHTAIARLVRID